MSRRLLFLASASVVWAAVLLWPTSSPVCRLIALDVGQGDAILVQTPDHQDILIDGGPNDTVVDALSAALPPGDQDLELVVLTHPHADHVNGLVAVTERLQIHDVLLTGLHFRQAAYAAWRRLLDERHVRQHVAVAGQSYTVGGARLDVLWPVQNLSLRSVSTDDAAAGGGINDSSIVLRLTCGGSQAMLMGDASSEIEERILATGVDVRAAALKVGHHGSRFSTSRTWLEAVQPRWAIISVGRNNRYHHPHPATLLRLSQAELTVLRTDQQGTIRLWSDGQGGWTDHRPAPLDIFQGLW